ncbi:MAG: hypothetical protein ABWZ79_03850 [Pedobacter agri]
MLNLIDKMTLCNDVDPSSLRVPDFSSERGNLILANNIMNEITLIIEKSISQRWKVNDMLKLLHHFWQDLSKQT